MEEKDFEVGDLVEWTAVCSYFGETFKKRVIGVILSVSQVDGYLSEARVEFTLDAQGDRHQRLIDTGKLRHAQVMKFWKTLRGFTVAHFNDLYSGECSIQESSSAERDALWLGVHEHRMHLDQALVEALLPALEYFAETGYLPEPSDEPT